jgi:uncharacterized protein YaiI (UPF0178 family)
MALLLVQQTAVVVVVVCTMDLLAQVVLVAQVSASSNIGQLFRNRKIKWHTLQKSKTASSLKLLL